jgi:hypothetical protein
MVEMIFTSYIDSVNTPDRKPLLLRWFLFPVRAWSGCIHQALSSATMWLEVSCCGLLIFLGALYLLSSFSRTSEVCSLIAEETSKHLHEQSGYAIKAIGISFPGISQSKTGTVWVPNIPG